MDFLIYLSINWINWFMLLTIRLRREARMDGGGGHKAGGWVLEILTLKIKLILLPKILRNMFLPLLHIRHNYLNKILLGVRVFSWPADLTLTLNTSKWLGPPLSFFFSSSSSFVTSFCQGTRWQTSMLAFRNASHLQRDLMRTDQGFYAFSKVKFNQFSSIFKIHCQVFPTSHSCGQITHLHTDIFEKMMVTLHCVKSCYCALNS